jgi:ergothioneine biosynthesis protein EgtB
MGVFYPARGRGLAIRRRIRYPEAMSATKSASNPRSDAPVCTGERLAERFRRVRARSVGLCDPLAPEDMTVQSMPDVSPAKWHLAHVTWFFERFLLQPRRPGYRVFHEGFDYLFNSYYFTVGQMHQRPRRGLLSRPTVAEVLDYRAYVDREMTALCAEADQELRALVTLGLNHEQQHQELILTDIKHVLAQNPLHPAYREEAADPGGEAGPLSWHAFPGGVAEIGAGCSDDRAERFAFDNETPRHRVWLEDFEIASRPVTNGEYRAFMDDGGYARSELWLADGWSMVQSEGWRQPLYWQDDLQHAFTLGGLKPIDPHAPVCHVSYYEADAYARWAGLHWPGARLPREAEWEIAAAKMPAEGHFAEAGVLQPRGQADERLRQLFGDVWEWTASLYAPYPGFEPLAGSLGEYNGKFMCSQMVLRGGSCATPGDHVRASYRNFFYPQQRWQFSGLRLARNVR